MALKQDGVHFTPCPKHDHKIEGVHVIWDCFPKRGQGFKASLGLSDSPIPKY